MPAATVVVLRLIRQRHEAGGVLLGKMLKAPANYLNANRLGGAMKLKIRPAKRATGLSVCIGSGRIEQKTRHA
jgi:hypothetical protein